MKSAFVYLLLSCISLISYGQWSFTKQDSLRGSLNKFRSNYDVFFYDLNIEVNPTNRSITGHNAIHFKATSDLEKIQLDLFSNLLVDSVKFDGRDLPFERQGNVFYLLFPRSIQKNSSATVTVFYHGRPVVSSNPPWDGGFVWQKDSLNREWIGVACEGFGASSWWPNKDHLSDEPDSMYIHGTAPSNLSLVANGRLRNKDNSGDKTTWSWFISYPINNYNVTLNIGHYSDFTDVYSNGSDELDLVYYVLDYNVEKAMLHFKQVHKVLESFEHYFGPYPFIDDSYKLVETPYWGMEHQSAISYGNDYENNPLGFDYIILHESAHEYFGNSISCNDHADMWIHESFATYMEALYLEYHHDPETAIAYLEMQKEYIANQQPIIGPPGVNFNAWDDADMYYKGAWMLHTLRNIIDDDDVWFRILRELYEEFKYSNVDSEDIIDFIDGKTMHNFQSIFNQYLNTSMVPNLDCRIRKKRNGTLLKYKWSDFVDGFNMPVVVRSNQGNVKIHPTSERQSCFIEGAKKVSFATDLQHFTVAGK